MEVWSTKDFSSLALVGTVIKLLFCVCFIEFVWQRSWQAGTCKRRWKNMYSLLFVIYNKHCCVIVYSFSFLLHILCIIIILCCVLLLHLLFDSIVGPQPPYNVLVQHVQCFLNFLNIVAITENNLLWLKSFLTIAWEGFFIWFKWHCFSQCILSIWCYS